MKYCPVENFQQLVDAITRVEQYLGLTTDTGDTTISGLIHGILQRHPPPIVKIIAPGNTEVIDSVLAGVTESRKWIIDYRTADDIYVKSVELFAKPYNGGVDWNVYGRLGDNDFNSQETTDLYISGSDMILEVTNNYTVNLRIEAQQIK